MTALKRLDLVPDRVARAARDHQRIAPAQSGRADPSWFAMSGRDPTKGGAAGICLGTPAEPER